ncbi:hypothetical protein ACOQFV_27350 [Nocardiopsis changdeensis]|uniref:Uncharacterized protein n=1 Tax=Nocardiopsis changdeensis TaxID=2831969 RepID=A0ABX8BL80_9ACTN|nr:MULTISPECIES: hypothetical protein [Nocardiopsis]QUX22985.1 hypothetical protein KGD84_00810 [Nocardiopsis changdeensis]QYX38928.1 hypothetical protein K1J57_10260 [Nocardiopsis sp. MT53]
MTRDRSWRRARPVRPSQAQVDRLRALSDLHAEWTAEHLDGEVEFRPDAPERRQVSDYNLHYLDVNPPADAEQEFHARARGIFGLDPETGAPPA